VIPEQLKYTAEHEWIDSANTADGVVRVGITDYAQEQLGDIVFAELPDVGQQISAGTVCGELESTKSVSDIYAPVTGTVVARNEAVVENPEVINGDPYSAGWMLEIELADPSDLEGLLSAEEYRAQTEG